MKKTLHIILSLLLVASVAVMTGCSSQKPDLGSADASVKSTKTAAEKNKKKDVEITISAAGDCTLGRDTGSYYGSSLDEFYDQKGADYFLQNVKPIFEKDDMTIVNFEGTLTESNAKQNKKFTFKGREEYLDILTGSGVDFMSLANNHVHDFGEEGYQDTMAVFEKNDVPYASVEDTGIYKVKGVTLGMVSVHGDVEQEESDYIEESIEKLKKEKVDIIITSIHTGIERDNYPCAKQKNLAHKAVDCGADLVLLHHPHVIQGVEYYKGVFIDYSLGNFCFGGNRNPGDKDTVILQKTFKMKNGKLQRDDQLKLIPCSISSEKGYNNYQPDVLEGANKERVIKRLNQYSAAFDVTFDENGNASVGDAETTSDDEETTSADKQETETKASASSDSKKESDNKETSSSVNKKETSSAKDSVKDEDDVYVEDEESKTPGFDG